MSNLLRITGGLISLYANQWWDSLLSGRHSLVAGFGLAFLVAHLVRRNFILVIILSCYLFLVSIPAVSLLKKEIPYIKEANSVKSLSKDSLLIESHFARPQVQDAFPGKLVSVNEPGFSQEYLTKEINLYLTNKHDVFVSSAALSEPYGLYSGPYLHYLTLSYTKPFELETIIKNYTLIKYKELDSKDNLVIYKIISSKKSHYPKVNSMKNSYRRIDFYDPLWRITDFSLRFLPQKP